MEAMSYEVLMRKAFGTGRDFKNGADADIYRKFEHAHRAVELQKESIEKKQPRFSSLPLADLEYEMHVAAGSVKSNLFSAINHVIDQHSFGETESEPIKKLKDCYSKLNQEFEREIIDSIIQEIHNVFTELNLSMR